MREAVQKNGRVVRKPPVLQPRVSQESPLDKTLHGAPRRTRGFAKSSRFGNLAASVRNNGRAAMASQIEFWIALTSPSSYLASLRIETVGLKHGIPVRWRPFNIRQALEVEGVMPNVMYERKGAYARRDWERTARFHGHPYRFPEPFGRSSLPAMAIAYWADSAFGHERMKAVCRAVMAAYFVENRAIDEAEVLGDLAEDCGLDRAAALAALDDTAWQGAIDAATEEAIESGVWGAPVMIHDGEPFWGADRVDQLDLWIERGGW